MKTGQAGRVETPTHNVVKAGLTAEMPGYLAGGGAIYSAGPNQPKFCTWCRSDLASLASRKTINQITR